MFHEEQQLLFCLVPVMRNLLVSVVLEQYPLVTVLFLTVTAIVCIRFVLVVAYQSTAGVNSKMRQVWCTDGIRHLRDVALLKFWLFFPTTLKRVCYF